MIRATVHNLRTPDWSQIDRRVLRDRMREHQEAWTITPWTHHSIGHRSYLIHSDDGALYAVFLART